MYYIGIFLQIQTLTILNLERNQIGGQGAQHLRDILRSNRVRKKQYFCHFYLALSKVLTTLKLRWNYLGENGARYLSDALRYNNVSDIMFLLFLRSIYLNIQTLITLDLSCNQIGNQGAQYLSEALRYNTVRVIISSSISQTFVFFNI
jgi:Ran GTPase-activating protein (RanGAP) involved in mRNA processing and transport